jgi:hypothetical protein
MGGGGYKTQAQAAASMGLPPKPGLFLSQFTKKVDHSSSSRTSEKSSFRNGSEEK